MEILRSFGRSAEKTEAVGITVHITNPNAEPGTDHSTRRLQKLGKLAVSSTCVPVEIQPPLERWVVGRMLVVGAAVHSMPVCLSTHHFRRGYSHRTYTGWIRPRCAHVSRRRCNPSQAVFSPPQRGPDRKLSLGLPRSAPAARQIRTRARSGCNTLYHNATFFLPAGAGSTHALE